MKTPEPVKPPSPEPVKTLEPISTVALSAVRRTGLSVEEQEWLENASLDMQINNFKTKHPDFDMIDLPGAASLPMKRAYVSEINKLFLASLESKELVAATESEAPEPETPDMVAETERTWLDGAELTMKIAKARQDYPELEIPPLPDSASLSMKQDMYGRCLKYITISNKANGYKFWLTIGIAVVEFVIYYWMGVDVRGFLKMQSGRMNKYKGPLWAMAEKNSISTGSAWPPEIQIIFIIMTNAVIFILIKVASNMAGETIGEGLGKMLMNALDSDDTPSDSQSEAGIPDVPARKNMDGLAGMLGGLANMFMGGTGANNSSSTSTGRTKKAKRTSKRTRTRPAHRS